MYRDQRRMPPQRQYRDDSMSLGKWIGTFIILMIPGVNFIAWLVWLFGGGKNATRTNWVRASLIMSLVMGAIVAILFFAIGFDALQGYIPNIGNIAEIIKIT